MLSGVYRMLFSVLWHFMGKNTEKKNILVNFVCFFTSYINYDNLTVTAMTQIIQLGGIDKRLYSLVAPLVMNPDVLKANNNYPFKTTDRYIWYIAMKSRQVIGFIPLERRSNYSIINNYYIVTDQEEILSQMISDICFATGTEHTLYSVAFVEHRKLFEKYGFVVEKEWKLYVKMRR